MVITQCECQDEATYLVLGQIIGQVGDHDLGLGGNSILGGSTLLLSTNARLAGLLLGRIGFTLVGDVGQRGGLALSIALDLLDGLVFWWKVDQKRIR